MITEFIQPVMLSLIIIGILFTTAFFSLLLTRWDFINETKHLTLLKKVFEDWIHGSPNPEAIRDRIYNLLMQNNELSHTLVYERSKLVADLMVRRIVPDIGELSNLTLSKKEAELKHQLINFAIAVLLIIGLAGTFWAFKDILTSSGLNTLTYNDPKEFEQVISNIYNGFQYAFLASLAGITSTVFLLFFRFLLVNPIRESFFQQLDQVTQTLLIPLFIAPNRVSEIENALSNAAQQFQTLSQEVKTHLSAGCELAEDLNEFAQEIHNTTQLFGEVTAQNSPFFQAVQRLGDTVGHIQTRYEHLLEQLAHSSAQQAELLEQNRQYHNSTVLTQTTFIHTQQKLETYLDEINQSVQRQTQLVTETLEQHSQQFKHTLDGLAKHSLSTLDQFPPLITALTQQQMAYTVHFEQAIDKLATSIHVIQMATDRLNLFIQTVNQHSQQLLPKLDEMALYTFGKRLDVQTEKLSQQLESKQQAFLQQVAVDQQALLEKLEHTDTLRRIEAQLSNLPKKEYSQEVSQLIHILEDMRDTLSQLQKPKRSWWLKS